MEAAGPIAPDDLAAADRALLAHPAAKEIWDWLARENIGVKLTLDSPLERELGFDSMDWLHLTLQVEQRIGREWTDAMIARVETVRDLLREIVRLAATKKATSGSFLYEPEAYLSKEQKRWINRLRTSEVRLASGLYRINRVLMRGLFRIRIEGLERVPRGQVVLAPTHGSFLDPFAIAAAFDRERLSETFWAADTNIAFKNPMNRWFSRLGQAVPFGAEHGFIAGMTIAAVVLERGYSLIWFPEGWRSRTSELQEFKQGIGTLLKRFPVPVVPIAIRGAHEAYPPGRIIPRPHPIVIGFGEPLDPGELDNHGKGAKAETRITHALRQHTVELYEKTGRLIPPQAG